MEFLSSENEQCPGSGLMLSLPSIRFCVSLVVCVHSSCFVGTRAASESTEEAPGEDEQSSHPFPCSRMLLPRNPGVKSQVLSVRHGSGATGGYLFAFGTKGDPSPPLLTPHQERQSLFSAPSHNQLGLLAHAQPGGKRVGTAQDRVGDTQRDGVSGFPPLLLLLSIPWAGISPCSPGAGAVVFPCPTCFS